MDILSRILSIIWRGFLWTLELGLFVLLGSLQFVERTQFKDGEALGVKAHLLNTLYEYRLPISLLIGIGYVLVSTARGIKPSRDAKEVRQTIMEALLEELFANDRRHVRITIFRDATLARRIWIYVKRLFSGTGGAYKEFGNYLLAWERLGSTRSSAFFKFDMVHETNCLGIAAVARHRLEGTLVEDLPDINQIDLECPEMANKKTKKYTLVHNYMNRSYLGKDLETLRRINRKALHIYGNVLSNRDGKFKGVLVVDSIKQNSPFSDTVLENLPYYEKIISETF